MLSGRSDLVVHGPSSDLAVVVVGIGATDEEDRDALPKQTKPYLVQPQATHFAPVERCSYFIWRIIFAPNAQASMDGTRLIGRLETDRAGVVVIGGPRAVARLVNRHVTGMCAQTLGASEQVLEMTVAYAKDRVQFGRPIGSFQAVKHRYADMLVDVEGMRSVAYCAAWSVGHDTGDSSEAASVAKTWCSDAAARVMY